MDTPEAKTLVKTIKKMDKNIFNIEYASLRDLVPLSSGNFGAVFCAFYKRRRVAVKKLLDVDDENMHKYLQREIETLRGIHHEHIVEFLGVCEHQSGLYIVTEFVNGGDLRKILKDEALSISWETRILLATHICSSIAFLHSQNIVHRDIKSHNILVTDEGVAKLCDFGFSRKLPRKKNYKHLSLCGTDQWMAPEILMDDPYNEKADVFSFAMVLYELVLREKPPDRDARNMYAFDVDRFRRLCPKDTPRGLVNIVIRCASLTPSKRPSLDEVLSKLEAMGPAGKTHIDLEWGTSDQKTGNVNTAKKSYKAKDPTELSVKKGDSVMVIQTDEAGWCEGVNNGQRGWFPLYVIQERQATPDRSSFDVDDQSLTSLESRSSTNQHLINHLNTRPNRESLADRNILQRQNSRGDFEKILDKKKKIETLSSFLRKKIHRRIEQQYEENLVDEVLTEMYITLPVATHKNKFEAYERCFPGAVAVEWLMQRNYFPDASTARSFMAYLMSRRAIIPLSHTTMDLKDKRLYQLKTQHESHEQQVINNMKTWVQEARHPFALVLYLLDKLKEYDMQASTRLSLEISLACCELQMVDLRDLRDDMRVPFFVNLYNLMSYYIYLRFGTPENDFVAEELRDKKAFLVGTSLFTLNLLKKSILFPLQPLPSSDPRSHYMVQAPPVALFLLRDPLNPEMVVHPIEAKGFHQALLERVSYYFSTSVLCDEHAITCPQAIRDYADYFFDHNVYRALRSLEDVLPPNVTSILDTNSSPRPGSLPVKIIWT